MLPGRPSSFLVRYARRQPLDYGGVLLLLVGGTCCAVGAQYGMKLIVDEMAIADRADGIWRWFALFVGLIAIESTLWRAAGWVGCHAIVETGVQVRLDLFPHLSGHPMQYFANHFSGALGSRVTTTAGATCGALGGLAGTSFRRASTSSSPSSCC